MITQVKENKRPWIKCVAPSVSGAPNAGLEYGVLYPLYLLSQRAWLYTEHTSIEVLCRVYTYRFDNHVPKGKLLKRTFLLSSSHNILFAKWIESLLHTASKKL